MKAKQILWVLPACFLMACQTQTTDVRLTEAPKEVSPKPLQTNHYVSDGYEQRIKGFDWVSVTLEPIDTRKVKVLVRSRADIKRPTCTFKGEANLVSPNVFKTTVDGQGIVFRLTENALNIEPERSDSNLNYFCSGGASLAGSYAKINQPLDEKQIDKTVFDKVLSMNGISFNVRSIGEGSINKLFIQPIGLKTDKKTIEQEIDGSVTNAEIADMDTDGYPELLIYTQSAGSGSYGQVISYSVNKGKSLSQIAFPIVADNPTINAGYMGHDEFAVLESVLGHRFPVYAANDTNAQPTSGKIRQIQYKLKNGEASKKWVIDKVFEMDK